MMTKVEKKAIKFEQKLKIEEEINYNYVYNVIIKHFIFNEKSNK